MIPNILYWDVDDFPVQIGTIVGYTDGWVQTHPELDIEGEIFQIVAYDEESGEVGILPITDTSGEWQQWHPNYTIPVQWEWNYRKLTAL